VAAELFKFGLRFRIIGSLKPLLSPANRGVGPVLGNFAIGRAEGIGASLTQEFLFRKFTRKGDHMK
jgi:hypothetical protein